MKYCKECGMLLEDTIETCIRCGSSVSLDTEYSIFPPDVEEKLEVEKKTVKKSTGLIALIVGVSVLLIGLVVYIIYAINSGTFSMQTGAGVNKTASELKESDKPKKKEVSKRKEVSKLKDASKTTDSSKKATTNDTKPTDSNTAKSQKSEVKPTATPLPKKAEEPSKGHYYTVANYEDLGKNVVFTAVYPKEFSAANFAVDTELYSTIFPEQMTFTCQDKEGLVNFTYMSPLHMWDKRSETGQSRNNERDPGFFMTFVTYKDAESFLKNLIKNGYPDAKDIKITDSYDINEEVESALSDLSDSRTESLLTDIDGDYANIGDNTDYAAMDAEYEAKVYEAEITTKYDTVVYSKFFVPVMANNITYANEDYDDRGTVVEWFALGVVGMEAGSKELYDKYLYDFDVFTANCIPKEIFFYTNECYSKEIKKAIKNNSKLKALSEKKLSGYGEKFSSSDDLSEFSYSISEMLRLVGGMEILIGDESVYVPTDVKVGYYNEDKSKLFISPQAKENPGDEYTQLDLGEE